MYFAVRRSPIVFSKSQSGTQFFNCFDIKIKFYKVLFYSNKASLMYFAVRTL